MSDLLAPYLIASIGDFDRYPEGYRCSAVAEILGNRLAEDWPPCVPQAFFALAAHLRMFPAERRTKSDRSPLHGMLGRYPIYGMLEPISSGIPAPESYFVRIIALLDAALLEFTGEPHVLSRGDELRRLASRLTKKTGAPSWVKDRFARAGAPGNELSLAAVCKLAEQFNDGAPRHQQGAKQLKDALASITAILGEVRVADAEVAPTIDLGGHSAIRYVVIGPDAGLPSDELEPDDFVDATTNVVVDGVDHSIRQFQFEDQYVRHQVRLRRPPLLKLGESLLPAEAKLLWSALAAIAREKDAVSIETQAALVLQICLVSAQPHTNIAKLRWSREAGEPYTLTLTGCLTIEVPGRFEYAKCPKQFQDVRTIDHFPLWLHQDLLVALSRLGGADGRVFRAESNELEKAVLKLLVEVRKSVSRATLERISMTLPTLVYEHCRDIRMAQLICGSNFYLAPWPVRYFSASGRRLQELHARVISTFLECDRSENFLSTSVMVGSALGSSRSAEQHLVKSVQQRLMDAVHGASGRGRRSFPHWYALMDAASLHCAWICSAAVGYRNTKHISSFNRLDLNLDQPNMDALIVDKVKVLDNQLIGHRVCSLGNKLLPDAIRGLLRLYSAFCELKLSDETAELLQDNLRRRLTGQLGLFVSVDASGSFEDATRDWLLEPIQDLQIPANLLRHRMATLWAEHQGAVEDLYLHLGHRSFECFSYGPHSGDCAELHVTRTAPVVESILAAQGWGVIDLPADITRKPIPDFDIRLAFERFQAVKDDRRKRAIAARRARREAQVRATVRQLISEDFDNPGPGRGPAELLEMVGVRVTTDNLKLVEDARREVEDEAEEIEDRRPSDREFPKSSQTREFAAPVSYAARAVMIQLRHVQDNRRQSATTFATGAANSDDGALNRAMHAKFSQVCADIFLWCPVVDICHLSAIIKALPSSVLESKTPIPAVRLALDGGGQSPGECQWIAPALAMRLSDFTADFESFAAVAAPAVVEKALLEWFAIVAPGWSKPRSLLGLFDLAHTAGKLEWPGFVASQVSGEREEEAIAANRSAAWADGVFTCPQTDFSSADVSRDESVSERRLIYKDFGDKKYCEAIRAMRQAIALSQSGDKAGRAKARNALKRQRDEFAVWEGDSVSRERIICSYALSLLSKDAKRGGSMLSHSAVTSFFEVAVKLVRSMTGDEYAAGDIQPACERMREASVRYSLSYCRLISNSMRRLVALAVEEFQFDPPDDAAMQPFGSGRDPVRPQLASAVELTHAEHQIQAWEDEFSRAGALQESRLAMKSRVLLQMLRRFGLRPGEAAGLIVDDLVWDETSTRRLTGFIVRNNSLRTVKSGRQTIISLDEAPDLAIQIDNCIEGRSFSEPVFFAKSRYDIDRRITSRIVQTALRMATGDPNEIPYVCRHTFANNRLYEMFSQGIEAVLTGNSGYGPPRIHEVAVAMSHIDPSTSFDKYIHTSKRAAISAGLPQLLHASSAQLARIAGISPQLLNAWSPNAGPQSSERKLSQVSSVLSKRFKAAMSGDLSVGRAFVPVPEQLAQFTVTLGDVLSLMKRWLAGEDLKLVLRSLLGSDTRSVDAAAALITSYVQSNPKLRAVRRVHPVAIDCRTRDMGVVAHIREISESHVQLGRNVAAPLSALGSALIAPFSRQPVPHRRTGLISVGNLGELKVIANALEAVRSALKPDTGLFIRLNAEAKESVVSCVGPAAHIEVFDSADVEFAQVGLSLKSGQISATRSLATLLLAVFFAALLAEAGQFD